MQPPVTTSRSATPTVEWWALSDDPGGVAHAFSTTSDYLTALCRGQRWNARMVSEDLQRPAVRCMDCVTAIEGPEGERRALDGNR